MCEICSGKESIDKQEFSIDLYEAELWIYYNGKYEGGRIYLDINYCPMCGRKLSKEEPK